MKTTVDTDSAEVVVEENGKTSRFPMDTAEAFDAVARAYLRVGWDTKYVYSFSWLGRPIIQLPDDMIRASTKAQVEGSMRNWALCQRRLRAF